MYKTSISFRNVSNNIRMLMFKYMNEINPRIQAVYAL